MYMYRHLHLVPACTHVIGCVWCATGGPEASIWRRPVILLVGDSITQMGSNEYDGYPGWVAHMQAHYNRKVGRQLGS